MSLRIKKGDTVEIKKGKDKGKTGKVMRVFVSENKAIVEGINMVKKHMKKRSEEQAGGIVEIAAPISVSNIALYCESCKAGVRFGVKAEAKTKKRVCKKCGAVI